MQEDLVNIYRRSSSLKIKNNLNPQSANYLIIYMNGYGFTGIDPYSRKQTNKKRAKETKRVPLPDPVDTIMHILLLKCAFKVIYSKTTLICML